jgi:replicative DNA helicase
MQLSTASSKLTSLEFTQTADIEESVLSYVLQNSDEIGELAKYFKPEHFTHKTCQLVYKAAIDINAISSEVDPFQIIAQLEKLNNFKLAEIGGVDEIHRLFMGSFGGSATKKSVLQSIDFLIELEKRRKFSIKMQDMIYYRIANLEIPFEKIVKMATDGLEILLADAKQSGNGLAVISSSIHSTSQAIIERTLNKREGIASGISSGFADVDLHTGGWQANDLVIIGARPGMGKSSFALSTCMTIAETKPVAFFSLEMDKQSMETRCISMKSGINSETIRDGKLSDAEIAKVLETASKLEHLNYWGTDQFSPSIDFVVSECRKLSVKQGQLGAICIDYIQLMVGKQENSLNEVSDITRKLKLLAVELKCPIFGLSQLNRSVESRNDKRPIKSDLRDSGSLEQDADIIIMLYRDEVYNPDTPDKGTAEILFRKFRNGREGTVKMTFDGATTQFRNLIKKY